MCPHNLMKNTKKKEPKPVRKKVNVGITMYDDELDEMRMLSRVDLNGPAVLSMARKGVAAEKGSATRK